MNQTVQIALIAATCGLATLSVASGLDRGIRILSELNLSLAVILLLFVLVLGPTVFLLQTYVQNTGAYLSDIVNKTFNLYAYEPTDWIGGWTLLYWGWWLSWSPFVGLLHERSRIHGVQLEHGQVSWRVNSSSSPSSLRSRSPWRSASTWRSSSANFSSCRWRSSSSRRDRKSVV